MLRVFQVPETDSKIYARELKNFEVLSQHSQSLIIQSLNMLVKVLKNRFLSRSKVYFIVTMNAAAPESMGPMKTGTPVPVASVVTAAAGLEAAATLRTVGCSPTVSFLSPAATAISQTGTAT